MKITFNKLATEEQMKAFHEKLLSYLNSAQINKELVFDLRSRTIIFREALTHEEDTFILRLLGQHSEILNSRFVDHISPE